MPHKLWKISARSSKRCGVQLRKTHGGGGCINPPPLHGRGLKSSLERGKSAPSNTETHIVEMVGQLFQQLKGICSVVQTLAEQVKTITTQIGEKVHSSESSNQPQPLPSSQTTQSPSTYATVTASQTAHPRAPSEDYRKIVREELRELEEQRKRKNSLVIRGLGATSASEAVKKFETLSLHLIDQKVTLTEVARISSETDLYRGKVTDDDAKKHLLDKAKQLKSSAQFSSAYIRRDLTFNQRQIMKAKREAATAVPSQSNEHGPTPTPPTNMTTNLQPIPHPTPTSEDPSVRTMGAGASTSETIPKQVMSPSS